MLDLPAFRGSVAFYPACRVSGPFYTPLLILIGAEDDWTPAESCVGLAETVRGRGAPVTLKVYAGAHHGFDMLLPSRTYSLGHILERHPQAAAEAVAEVQRFLAQHLGPVSETTR
jgi:dienelactone hydrolase